jgi:membrane protease YdiL (CAAX protease family)
MTNFRRLQILIGLALTLGVALSPLGRLGKTYSGLGDLVGGEVLWWIAVFVILLYVALVEHKPLSSIGLRKPSVSTLLIGAATGVLMVVGVITIFFVVFPMLHLSANKAQMESILSTPLWYRVLLVTRAAVAEEVLFRGYPIERIREWTGNRFIAALISIAAFTYAHLSSWGAPQLIVAGFGGVLLTGLYLWRRNLWANMLAHWIADGAGFLLSH